MEEIIMNFKCLRIFALLSLLTGINTRLIGAAAEAAPEYPPLKLVMKPTAIMKAAKEGDHKALQNALTAAPETVNYQNIDGYTALMYAASANDNKTVEILVDHKADPAILGFHSVNALHLACQRSQGKKENVTLCKNLITHNADVNT